MDEDWEVVCNTDECMFLAFDLSEEDARYLQQRHAHEHRGHEVEVRKQEEHQETLADA